MKFFVKTIALTIILALSTAVLAQEPELVNEIAVRINNDIITRADYLAALADLKGGLTRQMQGQGKSQAEIDAEFEKVKPTVLDAMIDEILLQQKAKEFGIDVEADINQRMAQIAKDYNLPNMLELEKAMRQQGVDPEAVRASLRKEFQQQYVFQREILAPIYNSLSDKEKRDFYEKNKNSITKPGEIELSEIFLSLEGYTATEVEQRAKRLVEELRSGVNFNEAVQKYSPTTRATRAQNGKLGKYSIGDKESDLAPDIAKAVSTLKVGEYTEPIRLQDGYQIIRVDGRKDPAIMPYEDKEVQNWVARAATYEKAEGERKKYLKKLREEAYIKVTKGYLTAQADEDKKEKN
jgi:peptidyl-prolyl cis-trans isomerase SurA